MYWLIVNDLMLAAVDEATAKRWEFYWQIVCWLIVNARKLAAVDEFNAVRKIYWGRRNRGKFYTKDT
jgi:hypothetical protein